VLRLLERAGGAGSFLVASLLHSCTRPPILHSLSGGVVCSDVPLTILQKSTVTVVKNVVLGLSRESLYKKLVLGVSDNRQLAEPAVCRSSPVAIFYRSVSSYLDEVPLDHSGIK
jgi:hypothetical protein